MIKLYDLKNHDFIDKKLYKKIENIFKSKKIKHTEKDIHIVYKRLNILRYAINIFTSTIISSEIKNSNNYINKIKNHINENCKYSIDKNDCFNILSFLIKNKNYVDGLKINNKDINNINHKYNKFIISPIINQNGGTPIDIFFNRPDNQSEMESFLDFVVLGLDLTSFIPGSGFFLDISNIVISLFRKRWIDAIWSVINAIPIVGSIIGVPGKYITKIMRYNSKHKGGGKIN
jgi:hypothetical protein